VVAARHVAGRRGGKSCAVIVAVEEARAARRIDLILTLAASVGRSRRGCPTTQVSSSCQVSDRGGEPGDLGDLDRRWPSRGRRRAAGGRCRDRVLGTCVGAGRPRPRRRRTRRRCPGAQPLQVALDRRRVESLLRDAEDAAEPEQRAVLVAAVAVDLLLSRRRTTSNACSAAEPGGTRLRPRPRHRGCRRPT
jgi:hypothetical protein